MKIATFIHVPWTGRACLRCRHSMFNLLLASGAAMGFAAGVRAQVNALEVGVRTKVVDRQHIWTRTDKAAPGTGGHGKVYGILAVAEIKSPYELVRPVDEGMILQTLSAEMNKNGFQLYRPGQKPDILITASYGRGELQNPYIRDAGETGADPRAGAYLSDFAVTERQTATAGVKTAHTGLANDSGAATTVIAGAFLQQLVDEKSFGYEAKLQRASTEKLYIRVTAWAYPAGRKAKTRMLWKTIMVVDDPDNRDLNDVAAKMLEAGAPLFDREVQEPEVSVFKEVPTGHVTVGGPEVVDPKSK